MRYVEYQLHAWKESSVPASWRSDGIVSSNVTSSRPRRWGGQDADDPPMIGAAHREDQVKSAAPQIHVEHVGYHRARHLHIGDEEHVLIRGTLERDAAELAHAAARTVAPGEPRDCDLAACTVRVLERCGHAVGILHEADQLGAPLHAEAAGAQRLAQQPFVVVLSQ